MKLFTILFIGLILMCISLLITNIYLLGVSEGIVLISSIIFFFRGKIN